MESKSFEKFGREGGFFGDGFASQNPDKSFTLYYPPPPADQRFSLHFTSLILDSSIWRTSKMRGCEIEYLIGWNWELLDVKMTHARYQYSTCFSS